MSTVSTANLWESEGKGAASGAAPKLRVGLIGCGGISGLHVEGWKRLNPDCQIVACADPIEAARNRRGDAASVPANMRFPYLSDILKAGVKLDAVDICTPNKTHTPITVEALQAGLNVLCEKPLAPTPDDVRQMMAARDKSGKLLMTAQNMRFIQSSERLHAYLQGGTLGDVYYARAHFLRRRYLPIRTSFIDKNQSGGGPTIDIGVHILDLALHLMGQPEPVSVTGITPQKLAKRADIRGWWGEWDRDKIDVEDFAAGFVRFKNGAALSLECSWLANIREPEYNRITILGTEAGADWPDAMIYGESDGSITDTKLAFAPDRLESHGKEITAFADALLTGKPSPVPAEQSLNVIRILDGLYRSNASGHEVTV